MFNDLRVRLGLIVALIVLSAWVLYDRGLTLGLDLQGGIHLAYEVRDPTGALTPAQRADGIDRALTVVRTRIDELGVAEPGIQKSGSERIVVELPGATEEQQQRAKDIIQRSAFLQFQIVRRMTDVAATLSRIDRAIAASGAAANTPAGAAAPAEPTAAAPNLGLFGQADSTSADSTSRDNAAVAGTDTVAGSQPFSSRVQPGSAGTDAIFLVTNEDFPLLDRYLKLPEVLAAIPRGVQFRWGRQEEAAPGQPLEYRLLYALDSAPLITGDYLQDAQAQRDQQMMPIVNFQFDRRGGRIFERGTGANVGRLMAIVLDENVVSAPTIQSQIGARGMIEMNSGTLEAASDLALVLRAGALPAPIEVVYQTSIGPTLGQDSIDRGLLAGVIGILFIILIMVGFYRVSGLMALAALGLYILLVLASMAAIPAVLTLPGIAGLILSIGMAVDANVLIFERIREELAEGRTPRVSVSEGFSNALSAIIDGHVTTLLTAFVLYQLGTGPVRGFAVTLAIGIIASLFTAIFVTRTLFMIYLDRRPAAETISI